EEVEHVSARARTADPTALYRVIRSDVLRGPGGPTVVGSGNVEVPDPGESGGGVGARRRGAVEGKRRTTGRESAVAGDYRRKCTADDPERRAHVRLVEPGQSLVVWAGNAR